MNILLLFVIIPLVMLLALWGCRNLNQVRATMVTGSTALLALSAYLTVEFISLRNGGNSEAMLYCDSWSWYEPLNICLSIGVDGISVAMLLLSSIIVFTGTFASWRLKPMTKEFFKLFNTLVEAVFKHSLGDFALYALNDLLNESIFNLFFSNLLLSFKSLFLNVCS